MTSEQSDDGTDRGGRFGRTPHKPEDLKEEYGTTESGRLDVRCPQCFRDWYPSSHCVVSRRAGSPFCPDCGADFRASTLDFEPEWPVGVGAVLYGRDSSEESRDLWHVTGRWENADGDGKLIELSDGTHTYKRHCLAEDLLADYTPAGWSWPTSKKPLYQLTRECGAQDAGDLMTDGGQPTEEYDDARERGQGVDHLDEREPLAYVYDGETLIATVYTTNLVEHFRMGADCTVSLTPEGEEAMS